jgi:DNA-binding CsgD family transcriptional regulator
MGDVMRADATLSHGQAAFAREAWADAYRELAAADASGPLDPDDLDRLATAAYLVGADAASMDARTRAHAGHLARADAVAAARSAYWLFFSLIDRPAHRAQAQGWLARGQRLLDEAGADGVERGLLACAAGFIQSTSGHVVAGLEAFEQAVALAGRFRDGSLTVLARHGVARCLIRLNRSAEAFTILDEVMIAVTGGEVHPMIGGVVYCSVISACHDAFDLRRAQEWTTALTRWCAAHPDMVAFRGQCLIRRAELLQLHGNWPEATTEAVRAGEISARTEALDAAAACYLQGELHRLHGRFAAADDCYRRAALGGRKPYPGAALLRLAEGRLDAAEAVVRCMLAEIADPRARARALGACVEVLLARPDLDAAQASSDELTRIATDLDAPALHAAAAQAAAALAMASGDAGSALHGLRHALTWWQELDAPYEVARLRADLGLVYRRLGDGDGAQLEFEAALEIFERLGAAPDAARVAALAAPPEVGPCGPLTGREVEVLRLVATGRTNRAIAADLSISEKTVARHLSNIFTKLDLPSRAAATAYAYEHELL